jgi:multiple sugar transport system permease protein
MTAVGASRRGPLVARYSVAVLGAALMVIPFLFMFSTSFKGQLYVLTYPPQFIPHHPTLQNYSQAWGSGQFGRYFVNSLIVAVATTICSVFLSAMMAFAFARFSFAGKELIYKFLLLGVMIPGMMLIIPQFVLARHLGLINSLLGLIVFYVGSTLSFNTFLLRGFFETIPREVEEAMIVDGARAWLRFRKLVLPLSRPALATTAIFSFLASWDEFVWALTIINDPQKRTLPIGIALFQGQNGTLWGVVFAASVIAVFPVILVFIAFQRQFISGLGTGALKG